MHGQPQIVLGAVNPGMAQVAGRIADGLYLHSFVAAGYLADVLLPAVHAGRVNSDDRAHAVFEISLPVFLATGRDDAELDAAVDATRKQIAFYASTPAYRAVLEHAGWQDIQPEAQQLARNGGWDAMAGLVLDQIGRGARLDIPTFFNFDVDYGFQGATEQKKLDPYNTWSYDLASWASFLQYEPPQPLADNTKPVLYTAGDKDPNVTPETVRMVADSLGGPVRVEILADGAHQLMLFETVSFSSLVHEFCTGVVSND